MKLSITAKNFLIVSAAFYLLYGIFCGLFPRSFAWAINVFMLPEKDGLTQLFRSTMGLLLGVGIFILCGAFIERYKNSALLVNSLCFGGLVVGGLIGFVADGMQSIFILIVFIIELILLFISLWFLLKKTYIE